MSGLSQQTPDLPLSVPRRPYGLWAQMALLAAVLLAYHYMLHNRGTWLGAVNPQTSPLYGNIQRYPTLALKAQTLLWTAAAALLATGWLLLMWRARQRATMGLGLLLMMPLVAFAINASVQMTNGGPAALLQPFEELGYEYYADVPRVESVGQFLHDYVELAPTLGLHPGTHPPGGVLLLYLVNKAVGGGVVSAVLASIAIGALGSIPAFLIARRLHGPSAAIIAAGLYVVTPNLVIYGATCMDAVFAFFPLVGIYLYVRSLEERPLLFGAMAGLALGLAAMFTYATSVVGMFVAIHGLLHLARHRNTRTLWSLGACGVAFVAFFLSLYAATGFNLIAALRHAIDWDSRLMDKAKATFSRRLTIGVGNMAAFLIMVGLPAATLWLRQLWPAIKHGLKGDSLVLAFVLALLICCFSGLFTMEVERIWLFFSPLVVIPAAAWLDRWHSQHPHSHLALWLGLLTLLQTLLLELRIDTGS
jgi:hypothetical protein